MHRGRPRATTPTPTCGRTYNGVLLGSNLADVIDALAAAERAEKLAQAV